MRVQRLGSARRKGMHAVRSQFMTFSLDDGRMALSPSAAGFAGALTVIYQKITPPGKPP